MQVKTFDTPKALGEAAGNYAALEIESAINDYNEANIILPAGASQFDTLQTLINYKIIDWSKVTIFHLDEYVGLGENHAASFRLYLRQRVLDKVGKVKNIHFVNGSTENSKEECERLKRLISVVDIHVALVGIGENGHLAFNDPPADFENEDSYIIVDLDEKCRMQQVGEAWFENLDDVPTQAITMSVKQIMKSKNIICSVPSERKAQAVKDCLLGKVNSLHPASILQKHDQCTIFLDKGSASLIL